MTDPHAGGAAPPAGRPALRMTWEDLLFLHWPVPVETLRPLVPEPLEVDTFDGTAWIGLVPFTMPEVRHWWMPRFVHLGMTAFHECNVRTYARHGTERGVWFLSLDAASRLAVWGARTFWRLPYFHAAIDLERDGREVRYAVRRLDRDGAGEPPAMRCRWRVGEPQSPSRPGDLADFLTERYQLFCKRNGVIERSRIWHPRWTLHDAELLELEDDLVAAAGVNGFAGTPLVHAAAPLDVLAWPLERLAAP